MFRMSPHYPYGAIALGPLLVERGRREEARSVAAQIGQSPFGAVASDVIMTMVESSELRFRAALSRARARLDALDRFQFAERGDRHLFERAMDAALVVGEAAPLADAFVTHFVVPDPPLLTAEHYTPMMVTQACTLASPAISRTCFARLRTLMKNGFFTGAAGPTIAMLDGFELHARGDDRAAAAILRSHAPSAGFRVVGNAIAAQVFDAAGEPDVADRFDAPQLDAKTFAGVTMAHVRAAKRAAARGDKARARELAEKVVTAWSTSDTPIPAVAEMKRLAAQK
jgi:hypothetical protein